MNAQAFFATAGAAAGHEMTIHVRNALSAAPICTCIVLPSDHLVKLVDAARQKTGAPEIKLIKAGCPDDEESESPSCLSPYVTVQDAGLESGDTLLAVMCQRRMVAVVGDDGVLRLWDITTGVPLVYREIKLFPERLTNACCISGDGNHLVTGSSSPVPKLWNVKRGEPVLSFRTNAERLDRKRRGRVTCVDVAPNASLVCSGGDDFVAKVWDIQGNLVSALVDAELETEPGLLEPRTHEIQLLSVKFSPDSRRVATCSSDCTVKIWSADREGECLYRLCHSAEAPYGMHPVTAICWSPSSRELVSATDTFMTTWDARTGEELRTWQGHTHQVTSAAFSIEGSALATGSRDGTVKVWSAETNVCLRTFVREDKRPEERPRVAVVDFHPDGKHVTTGYSDGSTRVWDVATGRCTHTLRSNNFPIQMASFVPL